MSSWPSHVTEGRARGITILRCATVLSVQGPAFTLSAVLQENGPQFLLDTLATLCHASGPALHAKNDADGCKGAPPRRRARACHLLMTFRMDSTPYLAIQ